MSKAVKAVGNAIGSVVKGVVKAVSSVVKAVVNVVSSVVNFIAQPFMGLLGGMGSVPDATSEAERQQGVLGQREGSVVNIPVIYGYRKVGGIVTFAETGSTNNQYLWVAYAFSEGPVEGLREVYLDDYLLPTDMVATLNAGGIVDITSGKYANRVKLQWFPGVYFDSPSSSTVGSTSICKDAPGWKSSMVYNGVAVLFARYEWKQIVTQQDADNNPFSGSIPVVQACILGKRVTSLVSGSPETQSYASSTTRYSTNPAEILLDYLRNPRYGKGLTNDDIDWTSWKLAAAKCNQIVTYVNGINGNILTSNYVLDTAQTIFANTKTLLMGMRAYMPYVQGKYKLKIEDAGNDYDILSGVATIVATFDKDNIQGNVTYTGIELSNKYNQVVINYVDPDNKWTVQQVVYPETEAERQIYIQQDSGRENKLEATFPTLTNYAIAKDMARLLFNKSRYQETCSLTVTSQGLELEPGDNIRIQSNLLNFGTTPWRIVQLTVNDDMTVSLSCVKNPDSIYPHTRVGEEDIVLPPYIPQGATIYYPGITAGPAIGLIPPTTAPYPGSGSTNPVTNPPPTNPGDPVIIAGRSVTITISNPAAFNTPIDHGLTGNGREELVFFTTGALPTGITSGTKYYVMSAGLLPRSFRVSLTPGGTTPVATSGTQSGTHTYTQTTYTGEITTPTPTPTPQPVPLDSKIDVTRIDYTTVNGAVNATITFTQPVHPQYAGVDFWFKRNISTETVYRTSSSNVIPGGGATITHTFEGLYKSTTPYILIARVKYSTGEKSIYKSTVYLNVNSSVSTENPTDFYETVVAGWTLPTEPLANPRDTIFVLNSITGQTVFASPGVPADPRQVTFTGKQNVDYPSGINYEVNGINIYYKQTSATTWKKTEYLLPTTYVPGTQFTYAFPGDLGVITYPNPDDASDNYDFIWRFRYRDGTESKYQMRYMGVDVERTTTANIVDTQVAAQGQELATDYPITLEDPATVVDTRLITVTLTKVENALSLSLQKAYFTFTPPSVTNQSQFWGVRIYYRPVTAGSAPAFTVADLIDEEKLSASEWRVNLDITYDVEYQYVVVPLVRYPSGTLNKVVANSGWIGQGKIHNRSTASDYPSSGNWFSRLNFRTIETSTIPGVEATPFPGTDPYVAVRSWKLIQINNGSNSGANSNYFELEFDKSTIAGYTKLIVYRRSRAISGSWYTANPGKYYQLGRWEQLEVVEGVNATLLTNGNLLVNLRLPVSFAEYNAYFTGFPETSTNTLVQGVWSTNKQLSQTGFWNEYLLVAYTASESPKVVRLPKITKVSLQGEVTTVETPVVEDKTLYAGFDAGYQRNLAVSAADGSRASLTLNLKDISGANYTAPTQRRGGAVV